MRHAQVNGKTITTIKHTAAAPVSGCVTYNFIILHHSFAPEYSFAWPQNVISFRNGIYVHNFAVVRPIV